MRERAGAFGRDAALRSALAGDGAGRFTLYGPRPADLGGTALMVRFEGDVGRIATAVREGNKFVLADYYAEGAPQVELEIDENTSLQDEAARHK